MAVTSLTPRELPSLRPQIIVCGLGRTGLRIYSLLRQQGAQVVGISYHPMPEVVGEIVVGELRSPTTLAQAGIHQAHTLVLATSDDALNLAILTQARILNPNIRIINRLFNISLGERLDHTLPHHVSFSSAALAAPLFAFAARGNRAIGQLRLFDLTWPMYEEVINAAHPWHGKLLKTLWDNRSQLLIHYHSAHRPIDLVTAVVTGEVLQVGDRVVVATRPQQPILKARHIPQFWQRLLVTLDHGRRRARATLLVILALLITIGLATFTYLWHDLNTNWVDALYFSVGMITGAGGQEQVAENSSTSIKVFTAVMMLVGAGVIGICYALLNDFILGSHFQSLWSVARMPRQHHYIICGLGGVGYRTAIHLHKAGYRVAVIEQDAHNRFLFSVKALKIPVIIADANLTSTLETVNLASAQALLVVTSDDTVNLEIALTARSISPQVPSVVRIFDAEFAQQVQQVFEFDQVLSPMDLAAPTFAAAALGGRILGNGMSGDLLWVAIATLITPHHPFYNQPIQTIAQTAQLVPLYIESARRTLHGYSLLNVTLTDGDVLYLTMPANRLDCLQYTPTAVTEEMRG
ncbi:NAD-binding protein [Nodosilinea sp. FACHB-131]|uniref:potassium channel family protein n=1 Tax=Cyanophyceae TaxID=3028117 RepID=UPI0016885B2E|nr:NAD-binding protein [Nodosilinea sp. FACHB-131]MBD1876781.1 NAD-binding protein [Nodosilinea sp. FACHB-131]